MPQLKYHQKSLDLINSQAVFSGASYSDLPSSVAEWYSLVNGLQLLEKYSNEDYPLPPAEFKTCRHHDKELVVFMYENQGVLWWAFEKCDQDDPPVYVNLDPPPDDWTFCCEKFSEFVYSRIFDFFHWHDENLIVLAVGKPLEKHILDLLSGELTSHSVMHGGFGHTQHRFSHNDRKILIKDSSTQSEWHLSADSPHELGKLVKKFKNLFEWYFPKLRDD